MSTGGQGRKYGEGTVRIGLRYRRELLLFLEFTFTQPLRNEQDAA